MRFNNDFYKKRNKKGIDTIKKNLEKIVIPCFCYAIDKTDEEKRGKMNKVHKIA